MDANGANVRHYLYNGHGDTTQLTDSAGNVIINYDYDAFGNEKNPNASDTNPFRYCGEYTDLETNSIYLRARYYSPGVGRFMTEDPARSGLNWYVYCSNNPVNKIDPLGLFDYNTRLSYSQEYNDDVKVLQNALVQKGYMSAPTDDEWGYFGSKTQAAVNAYKKDMKLGNSGKDKGVVGLQTWTSLGLTTYRTQKDIDAGVTIATLGFDQYKDISTPVNNALNRDKGEFADHNGDLNWFGSIVGDTGKWNVKRNATTWEGTIGSTFPGYGTKMLLYGKFVTVEQVGNITYGYLGGACGLDLITLTVGSMANHFKNHLFNDWNNEFNDDEEIKQGFQWFLGANQ